MLLSAGFVLLTVIYLVAFERFGGSAASDAAAPSRELLPFQVLFRDLPGPEQRVFREMQEGVAELLRIRSASGDWSAVAPLASDGIPPFAADALDTMGLSWGLRREGLVAEYVADASAPGAPAFMICVREPDPVTGEKARPGVVDEEHQLLSDGTLLHVTYWKRPGGAPAGGVIQDPALEGWLQIRIKTLFEEAMP